MRKEFLTGEPKWVDEFPEAVRLESKKDPADKQAPEIKLRIKAFSRPVLRFQVKLRDDQIPTEVFVAHFKSKQPTGSTRRPGTSRPRPLQEAPEGPRGRALDHPAHR